MKGFSSATCPCFTSGSSLVQMCWIHCTIAPFLLLYSFILCCLDPLSCTEYSLYIDFTHNIFSKFPAHFHFLLIFHSDSVSSPVHFLSNYATSKKINMVWVSFYEHAYFVIVGSTPSSSLSGTFVFPPCLDTRSSFYSWMNLVKSEMKAFYFGGTVDFLKVLLMYTLKSSKKGKCFLFQTQFLSRLFYPLNSLFGLTSEFLLVK